MPSSQAPSAWVAVTPADALPNDAIIPAHVAGFDLIVIRAETGVWACQRSCPHEYADLLQGHISGDRLFCGRHRASFSLADGKSGSGWDLPRLKTYRARIVNGQVEIDATAVAEDPPMRRRRLEMRRGGE